MKLVSSEIFDKEKLNNTLEIIQFLIERGADINMKGFDEKNVLDVVRNSNFRDEILKVIINTKQIYFYINNNIDTLSPETNKNTTNNDFYDANITKTNCCNICIIL